MKIFFRKIVGIFILFILFVISILMVMFSIDTVNSTAYLKAYSDKKEKLKEIKAEQKIIFVGGSNIAFGLNSEEIKENFPEYKILNYGLHAGIGIKYILEEIEEYMREEDILIVIPEYENFYNEGLGEQALWEIVGIQKSLKSLDFNYLKKLTKITIAFKEFININNINQDYGKKFTYDRRGFNKYGDYIEHWKFEEKNNVIPGIMRSEKFSEEYINEFKDKLKKFENRGIKTFLLPAVYQNSAYQLNKTKLLLIEEKLNRYDIKINEYVYHDELFFDTIYHLNKKGVNKRTKQIIQYLKNKI